MNTGIRWGNIGAITVAILGVAVIFFLIGKTNIERMADVPVQVAERAIPVAADAIPPQESGAVPHIYKNDTYGFGAVFLARAEAATECPLDSRMAYDPIKEYVFALQPIECARDTEDTEGFYNERGGQLETMVFDLKKCRDAESDQTEKGFCSTYDKAGAMNGKTTEKEWPIGTWTKSGDYVTFYLDLTFGKNEHWKSDYKFLVLER